MARNRYSSCLAPGAISVLLSFAMNVLSVAAPPPNIILILTDDQGYGDFSCHGNPVLQTPNLDRLHKEGRRFTDFQVSPTCAPTRTSLMTGRHEFISGVTHTIFERERMSLKPVILPQVLKSAGYTTGIFGKWHLGDEPDRLPGKRGFDEVFIHGAGGIGQSYPGSCGDAPGNRYFNPVILHNGTFEQTRGYCTDVFFNQALRWMEQRAAARQRFFAYITPNAPHTPLDVPEQYERRYADKVPQNTAKFFGMIANIDDNVGRLLEKLKEWKIERDTLVIFMNDNGGTAGIPVFNAGMRGRKGSPWSGGVRAASFWRWPGTLVPGDITSLAAHIDVLPTLAEIAGTKPDSGLSRQIEGRSLLPLLRDPSADWPNRTLVTHVGRWERGKAESSRYARCSIRDQRWRMVCDNTNGTKQWQLFDLKADPGEKKDIAAAEPEVVRRLEAAYDRWWQEVLPCLENEDAPLAPENSFKTRFRKQFGDRETLRREFLSWNFGLFLHFNLATFADVDWATGHEDPAIFSPANLDCKQWADAAKAAGMKYGVLTVKHTEGCALWDSEPTSHDITAFKRYKEGKADLVRDFVDAFRSRDLKVGLYYCFPGDYSDRKLSPGQRDLHGLPPEGASDQTGFMKKQLTELLTRYGPIDLLWIDQYANRYTAARWPEFQALVHTLQPCCLLLGNNAHSFADSDILSFEFPWSKELPAPGNTDVSEVCDTIQSGSRWFWDKKARLEDLQPAEELARRFRICQENAANYLLNVPPDTNGLISDPHLRRLQELAKRVSR